MTSQETSPRWAVINKENGSYWAGGNNWYPTDADAETSGSRQEAKAAYRDVHGSFPRTLDVVEVQAHPVDSDGVTAGVMPADAVDQLIDATAEAEQAVGTEVATMSDAQALDSDIRYTADRFNAAWSNAQDIAATLVTLIDSAQKHEIHAELGFDSWPLYVADIVATNMPAVGQVTEARQVLVGVLTDAGLSQRAQAAILEVSHVTISRDQKVLHDVTPPGETFEVAPRIATVTSITGETYQRPQPAPEPTPVIAVECDGWIIHDQYGDAWCGDPDYRDYWGTGSDLAIFATEADARRIFELVTGKSVPRSATIDPVDKQDYEDCWPGFFTPPVTDGSEAATAVTAAIKSFVAANSREIESLTTAALTKAQKSALVKAADSLDGIVASLRGVGAK